MQTPRRCVQVGAIREGRPVGKREPPWLNDLAAERFYGVIEN